MGRFCLRKRIVSNWTLSVALLLTTGIPAFATITVSPSSISFANQTVGTTSPLASVSLTNFNTGEIEIVKVACSLPQFSYSGPALPIVLHPGGSLAGTVVFRPTSVQTYSGSLVFTRLNGSTVTIPLSGTGIQATSSTVAPSISAQPANQTVVAGQTATFSVNVTGTAPLSYQWRKNGTAISGAASSSYTTPAETISDNGAQFTVLVSNSAGSVTSAAATLTVTSPPGTLSLSSSSLTFGSVNLGSTSTLSTTLTNSGSSSVTVSSVSISGPGFNASGIATGQIIGAGQTATLKVSFAPATTGSVSGSVTVTSNASNSPASISLSGTGAAVSYSAALSWTASASSVIGYNVYRSTISGGPYTKLTPTIISTTSYSDTAVQAGQTYYYVVTAMDSSNIESAYSNQVAAPIP